MSKSIQTQGLFSGMFYFLLHASLFPPPLHESIVSWDPPPPPLLSQYIRMIVVSNTHPLPLNIQILMRRILFQLVKIWRSPLAKIASKSAGNKWCSIFTYTPPPAPCHSLHLLGKCENDNIRALIFLFLQYYKMSTKITPKKCPPTLLVLSLLTIV